ncbi:hypothetical protein [Hymenobacter ruricola]|uniref:Lipocalin-like domain-containing protein n=1 Tax=Hymenobacter ruricola TaxID=2791023 RepID=A0ABS0I4Q1_9BACT|nr:hypothetical protein [Hymenobacter ruricola]MBF9221698.1 hypothetical protein [Hymenobacter ruricola]
MTRIYSAWFVLLTSCSACTPTADPATDTWPLQGVWEGERCVSLETNALGRRVFARTDVYRAGQVVCAFTPTEVRHYHGRRVQVWARYTRTRAGFRLGEGHGPGALRIPGNSGDVAINSLTRTRLVVRQVIPSSDTTTLTSIITYSRRAHFPPPE